MTLRQQLIIKSVLQFLERLDGAQAEEPLIHASVQVTLRNLGHPSPSLAEFETSLMIADQRRWLTGVPSRFTGRMKWNLSNLGQAALLEL